MFNIVVLTSSTKTVSSRKRETKTKCLILWCWRPLQSLYLAENVKPKTKCLILWCWRPRQRSVSSRKRETKTKCLVFRCWRPRQSLYLAEKKCQSKLRHQFPYVLKENSTRHLSRKSAEVVSPSITISAVNIRCTYLDVIKHHTWRRRLIHFHPVKGWQHSLWWHIYWFIWSRHI